MIDPSAQPHRAAQHHPSGQRAGDQPGQRLLQAPRVIDIEEGLLQALRDRLLSADAVRAHVTEYHKERARLARDERAAQVAMREEAETLTQELDRFADAIAQGLYSPHMGERVRRIEARRDEIARRLAMAASPSTLEMHPGIADNLARGVARLHEYLRGDDPESRAEAIAAVRRMFDAVQIFPATADTDSGLPATRGAYRIQVTGMIAATIQAAEDAGAGKSRVTGSLVAGRGFPVLGFACAPMSPRCCSTTPFRLNDRFIHRSSDPMHKAPKDGGFMHWLRGQDLNL